MWHSISYEKTQVDILKLDYTRLISFSVFVQAYGLDRNYILKDVVTNLFEGS